MRKLLAMVVGMLCLSIFSWAQTRVLTGKVVSATDGSPIPNATLSIKGTSSGVSSNSDGSYTISVPSGARLLSVSSVGFQSVDVAIPAGNTLEIRLLVSNENLDEVLVVAYGTVKKSEFTGSAAQISAKDFEKRPLTNALNALVGSAPGIQTTTPGGSPGSSPGIRLRGYTSYSAGSGPLIIVDGAVYNGGIANINPDDIETISTLKDAATTALYGSRGANGVIQITTKRGKKNKSQLSFKAQQGYTSRAIPEYETVTAQEYYPLMWEAYRNSLLSASPAVPLQDANGIATGTFPRNSAGLQVYNGRTYSDIYQQLGRYNPFRGIASNAIVGVDGKLNPNAGDLIYSASDLDWFGAFYRNGSRADYSMTYSGGAEKSDYFGSLSYTNETGFASRSGLERYAGRLSVNSSPVKWLRIGTNLNGTFINSNFPAESGIVNPFSFARSMGPIYPVFAQDPVTGEYLLDAQGRREYDIGNLPQIGSRPLNQGRHAIWENILNVAKYRRNMLSGRATAEIIFTPWLSLVNNVTLDIQDYTEIGYQNPIVGDGAPAGRASREINRTFSYTANQLLQFNKKFGDHNISGLVGHENYARKFNYFYGFRIDQGFQDGNTEFGNFATISTLSSYENNHTIESYLSRLNYDYGGRYYLSGSFRRDGNSKFDPNVRWANFWSVGLGWRLEN